MHTSPAVRRAGNWILTLLFLLGLYAFANLAWSHYADEGLGVNTWIYIFAALGALSLAFRYGRVGFSRSSNGGPA